jgi:hypothetical protein
MGRQIHEIALKYDLELDHFVCAALVDMYAKCRAIHAWRLFVKMQKRDLVTWTRMIGVYADCGNANKLPVLFDRMVLSWIRLPWCPLFTCLFLFKIGDHA